MHRAAWVLQLLLGAYFIGSGVVHFVVPDGLPGTLEWMYDLPTWAHYVSGSAEILGGLGLILPGLTRIAPRLTPLAAAGLALVMLLAAIWHISRGEAPNTVGNIIVGGLLVFVASVRWRRQPLPGRGP